jgi:hypothetical protein
MERLASGIPEGSRLDSFGHDPGPSYQRWLVVLAILVLLCMASIIFILFWLGFGPNRGTDGRNGTNGANGATGSPGIPGSLGIVDSATFYAIQGGTLTPDNPTPIPPGSAILFPQTQVESVTGNIVLNPSLPDGSSIQLGTGRYQIVATVPVSSSGQIVLVMSDGVTAIELTPSTQGIDASSGLLTLLTTIDVSEAPLFVSIHNPQNQVTNLTVGVSAGISQPQPGAGNAAGNAVLSILQYSLSA